MSAATNPDGVQPVAPYDAAAEVYLAGGLWPIPVLGKAQPVTGTTGYDGTVTYDKVNRWLDPDPLVRARAGRGASVNNIAIRHQHTLAVDVDHGYGDKNGVEQLAAHAARHDLPPLPATWSSTARGDDSPSRQYIYRIPGDVKFKTKPCKSVELCTWHHRYTVCAPSVHPTAGRYTWYLPGEAGVPPTWGSSTTRVPRRDDFAELPVEWLEHLRGGVVDADRTMPVFALADLLARFPAGDPDPLIRHLIEKWRGEHVGHDECKNALINALILGREGRVGVPALVELLVGKFAAYVRSERPEQADGEVARLVEFCAEIAQQKPLPEPPPEVEDDGLGDRDVAHYGAPALVDDDDAYWQSVMADAAGQDEPTGERSRVLPFTVHNGGGEGGDPEDVPLRKLLVQRASQVPKQRAVWLWTTDGIGRIPCAEVTLAAGRGNVGKSPFALWLCARLTRGELPGNYEGAPTRVAVYASEDSHSHTTVPRLEAAGADLDMVDLIVGTVTITGERQTLEWWRDLELIEGHLVATGARFLVIDPMHDVHKAGADTNKTDDVRQGIRPLVAMAHRTGVSILGLAHFNKAKTSDVASLLSGAHGLRDIVRAVLVFVEAPDGQKVLGQDKNNLGRSGPDVPRITYEMDIVPVEIDGAVDDFPVFKMTGTTEATIADIVGGTVNVEDLPIPADLVWMVERLADAAPYGVEAAVLAKEAESRGLKWDTVRRHATRSPLMEKRKRPKAGQFAPWEWLLTEDGRTRLRVEEG
jgi:hypothetical protein